MFLYKFIVEKECCAFYYALKVDNMLLENDSKIMHYVCLIWWPNGSTR